MPVAKARAAASMESAPNLEPPAKKAKSGVAASKGAAPAPQPSHGAQIAAEGGSTLQEAEAPGKAPAQAKAKATAKAKAKAKAKSAASAVGTSSSPNLASAGFGEDHQDLLAPSALVPPKGRRRSRGGPESDAAVAAVADAVLACFRGL